jgi:hypothetical protein
MDVVGAGEGSDLSGGRRHDEEGSDKNVEKQVCVIRIVSELVSHLQAQFDVKDSSHLADLHHGL